MPIIFYASALGLGLAIATQAAINNQLKTLLGGHTLLAASTSFFIGTVCLIGCCLFSGQTFTPLTQLQYAKWWMLLGGVFGALFVYGATWLVPHLGMASLLSLIIFGQIMMSLVLDQFGLLGLPQRDINVTRLLGAVLVFLGTLFINFDRQ